MLDAWVVVRFLEGEEPAASALQDLLTTSTVIAVMSTVTYAEASWALASDLGLDASHPTVVDLREVLDLQPPSVEVAETAARLKRGWHLSLGDALVAATALVHRAPLWTGDPELLTSDRCWLAHDLRSAQLRHQHADKVAAGLRKIGRRTDLDNDLSSLSTREIADHVLEPLAQPISPPEAALTL